MMDGPYTTVPELYTAQPWIVPHGFFFALFQRTLSINQQIQGDYNLKMHLSHKHNTTTKQINTPFPK